MRGSSAIVAPIVIALLVAINVVPCQAGLVIGVFDTTRATTANVLTGDFSHDAIQAIQNNFPGTTFVSFPTLTAASLAGVNILLLASDKTDEDPITPLSSSEQTAMLNFVKGGGSAMLLADTFDDFQPASQSLVGPFGLTIADDGHSGVLSDTITAAPSPVTNGPFGKVTSMVSYGAGNFTNLGPHATSLATMNVTGLPVLAAIEAHALGPNSGRVVLYTDATQFTDDETGGFFSQHKVLFLNTIQYLAPVPEPGTLTLGTMAACGLGVFTLLRRRRPAGA